MKQFFFDPSNNFLGASGSGCAIASLLARTSIVLHLKEIKVYS